MLLTLMIVTAPVYFAFAPFIQGFANVGDIVEDWKLQWTHIRHC